MDTRTHQPIPMGRSLSSHKIFKLLLRCHSKLQYHCGASHHFSRLELALAVFSFLSLHLPAVLLSVHA